MAEPTFLWQTIDDMTAATLLDIVSLRESVFVVGQACAYQEMDALDRWARHLSLFVDDELAGYLRVVDNDTESAIGRVIIAPTHRGQGLAYTLVREAMADIRRRRGKIDLYLGAQAHLCRFYEKLGFAVVSAPYLEIGIPHRDMRLGQGN